jgi:protein SCO1/2
MKLSGCRAALFAILAFCAMNAPVAAEYNRVADSAIDLDIFKIDEKAFLGTKLDSDYELLDEKGHRFSIGDITGRPLIMVLSYYKCDGVCSAVNSDLKEILKKVRRQEIGKDFSVITISFDKYDSPETLSMFVKELNIPERMRKGWKFTLANNPEDIHKFTDALGFKYFWSPRDRTFFHPNVYLVITPEGRVSRYLYANTIGPKDIELSLLEAGQEQIKPSEVINLIVSYCYSYNYKEGKYSLNIPLFVALGSLSLGITAFVVSAVVYRKSHKSNV